MLLQPRVGGGGGVPEACGAWAGGDAGAGGSATMLPPAVLSCVRSAAWLKVKPSPKSAAKEAWPRQDEAPDGSPRRDAIVQEAVRFVQPVFHLWERRGPGTQGLVHAMLARPAALCCPMASLCCQTAPCTR